MTNDQPHAGCGGRKATGTGEAPASPGGQRHHRHRSDPRSAGQGGQHGRAQGGDGVDVALGEAVSGAGSGPRRPGGIRRPLGAVVDLGS